MRDGVIIEDGPSPRIRAAMEAGELAAVGNGSPLAGVGGQLPPSIGNR
jgi:hypothetical protein